MKVMLVSNLYGALARGGAERVVEIEAAGLAEAGHVVTVVSGVPARAATGTSSSNAVRHLTYQPPNLFFYTDLVKHGLFFRLAWHFFDALNTASATLLGRIVRDERPEVVHTHNLMGLGFMIPSMLCARGVHHVHTVHDVQLLDPSGLLPADREFVPAPHQAVYIALMRRLMGSPAVVIFPSEFHKRLHERFGFFPRSRRVVVRNPAARAAVANRPDVTSPDPITAKTGVTATGGKTFLFVGQLEKHKGVFDLLEAWRRAAPVGATLEIAGIGSRSVDVAAAAVRLPGVKLLGRLAGAALDAAYDRATWVVVPSRVIENAPAVLMEAAARGVPAIAAAAGGIPEIAKPGESGLLFPPGDLDALARSLATAADMTAGDRSRLADAARRSAAGLDVVAHVAALVDAYRAPTIAPKV